MIKHQNRTGKLLILLLFMIGINANSYAQLSDSIFSKLVSHEIKLTPAQVEKYVIEAQYADTTYGHLIPRDEIAVKAEDIIEHLITIVPIGIALDTTTMSASCVPITKSEQSYAYFIVNLDGFRHNTYKYEFGENIEELINIERQPTGSDIIREYTLFIFERSGKKTMYSVRLFPPDSSGHPEYDELSIFCIPYYNGLSFYDKRDGYPTFEDLLIANFGSGDEYIRMLYKSTYGKF